MARQKTIEEIFCENLGVKPGFLKSISSDTDWGFAIKAHAMIEGALNNLMVARFNEPLLLRILSNLGTSAEENSKLSILKELKLVTQEHRAFIRAMSRLRNAFAHDIKRMDCTLAEYLAEDAGRAKELRGAIEKVFADPRVNGETIPKAKFIAENFRLALWSATLGTVHYLIKTLADYQERAGHGSAE